MSSRASSIFKLQIFTALKNSNKLQNFKHVHSLLPKQQHTFTSDATLAKSSLSSSEDREKGTHLDSSSLSLTGIAKSVLLRSSHLLDTKKDESYANVSLKDLLLNVSGIVPGTARKFSRLLVLKPENVLELLVVFQLECEKGGFRAEKVETVWTIFKRGGKQLKGFRHLPRSFEVMALMLIQVGMLREVELLLLKMERDRILLNSNKVLSNLIEGYVGVGDLERAVLLFDQMRGKGLVPSLPCYCVFIDNLVKMERTHLAFRVCSDMVVMGNNLTDVETDCFENVVRLLCRDGRIQESRKLVRKAMAFGLKPSGLVLNEIALAYCEKKDFEELLSFFCKTKCSPDVLAGNRMVHTLCSIFGVKRTDLFRMELEHLGFRPDEITFGILMGWSCHEGNLRRAFIFLSEILSRGLNPNIHSYNSLISGLFKEGMGKHAKDILDEMVNKGITPTLSTHKILLAGYCKGRQFDEAKIMVSEMAKSGFIELSSLEDPLSKAFIVLGLNPLAVRLRRDNDMGFSRAEFFDNLGNGLYLDTDKDEYDKKVTEILEDSMIPNFISLIKMEYARGNLKAALLLVDEMVRWGQEPSLSVFSALVKRLCASRSHIKACICLLEKMPKLANQLGQESLNLLVQACCRKGLVNDAKNIFDRMLQRGLTIENETYTALLVGFCKKGFMKDLRGYWYIAQDSKWLPQFEDVKALVECLCYKKMLRESLELVECMLEFYPCLRSDICSIFVEKFCITGFSSTAHALMEELLQHGCLLDQMTYSHLIRGLCKEKKYLVAFKMLDSMLAKNMTPCSDVSVTLIPQLFRADRFEKAVALRESGLKEQPLLSSSFYSAFIKGFCMTGKVEEASKVFKDMVSKGLLCEDEVYNNLIQGHCQDSNLKKVKELLAAMVRKSLSLSMSSYRNLVRCMCITGRFPWALNLKEFMLGQSKSHNPIFFNVLVFYLMSSGNNFMGNKVLNELLGNELLLDEVASNFLVYWFSKREDVSSSLHYLSTMISNGFTPSNRSLRLVISCLCEVGELGKALELSQEMKQKAWIHDSIVQNAIVEGLLSHGRLQEAECFLDQMVDKNLIPDHINYDNLIKRFCRYGRVNKAVDLLNIMLKKGSIPNSASYDSIIYGFSTRNKLDQALDFHAEMLARDLKPSMNTWDILVQKLCHEGRTAEAESLLISMIPLGQNPTREMYLSVVSRHSLENNLRKASELMHVMQQSGHNPDFSTHWSLISNLSRSNDKSGQGFLSRLLSGSGFSWRKDSKA